MNARELAAYRDELARHGIAEQDREETLRRAGLAAAAARKGRTRKPRKPRPPTRSQQERLLAAKLLPYVSEFSTIRPDWQALDVARLVIQARLKAST